MAQTLVDSCPACGEAIFATARCEIGAPVNLVVPVYLANVVLDRRGGIVGWKPGFDTLTDSMDFCVDDYEPHDTEVYCDNGHDPVALLATQDAEPEPPQCSRPARPRRQERALVTH